MGGCILLHTRSQIDVLSFCNFDSLDQAFKGQKNFCHFAFYQSKFLSVTLSVGSSRDFSPHTLSLYFFYVEF